jgi:hypothetical protein
MHVTTKEIDENGVHILTSILEGDGAVELASDKASLSASVISAQRTESGGVKVQVALRIVEPAPEQKEEPKSPEEQALAYLKGKGFNDGEAAEALKRFGLDRVLGARNEEADAKNKELDEEFKSIIKK